jgi:signal transduction histidine kinase
MSDARPARHVYYLITAVALAVSLGAVQGLTRLSRLPPEFPPGQIDYPARLGDVTVGSPAELHFLTQSRPIGSEIEVRSDTGTFRSRLLPQLSRSHLLLIFIESLIFIAVNLIVFCPRVDRGPVRDFYWCTLLYGVAVALNGVYFPQSSNWAELIRPLIWIGCLAALPVFFLHMSLAFPRRDRFLDRYPAAMPIISGVSLALFVWQSFAVLRYFAAPSAAAWAAAVPARLLAESFLVAAVAAGCFILYRRGRDLQLTREREQTKWLLWGFTIGVTPYVFLRTLPKLAGVASPIPPELDRVFELTIPMAFTLAVVRYRFLDIDIIIRRSLIYGILAGLLAGLYFLVWTLAGQRLVAQFPHFATAIQAIAIALPVALFNPTRRWIGHWVDRTFFKIQYNFDLALVTLEQRIRVSTSQEEIAEVCVDFLERQLLLRNAAVVARRGATLVTAGDLGDDLATNALRLLETMSPQAGSIIAAPNTTSRPEIERSDFPDGLFQAGARIAVRLDSQGRTLWMILVGDKATERRFIDDDLRLLERVRAEAAAMLERVELVQLAAEAAQERERVQVLDRMKTDFFSRVAHDLRTPLTSIQYTVENLLDGVRGAPPPEYVPHLQAVRAASSRLGRLVSNLLDLSRLDQPEVQLRFEAVSLALVVRDTLATLGPIGAARGVRLEFREQGGVGPVRGDRDKVYEIVANLMENATRYSPDRSTVEIALQRCVGDRQSLEVRDHGPGIGDGEHDRIFDRFHQGKPSPYSRQRGFGLGLYVARSYAELMGGSVTVSNHPDGGARFVCTLPEWEVS